MHKIRSDFARTCHLPWRARPCQSQIQMSQIHGEGHLVLLAHRWWPGKESQLSLFKVAEYHSHRRQWVRHLAKLLSRSPLVLLLHLFQDLGEKLWKPDVWWPSISSWSCNSPSPSACSPCSGPWGRGRSTRRRWASTWPAAARAPSSSTSPCKESLEFLNNFPQEVTIPWEGWHGHPCSSVNNPTGREEKQECPPGKVKVTRELQTLKK